MISIPFRPMRWYKKRLIERIRGKERKIDLWPDKYFPFKFPHYIPRIFFGLLYEFLVELPLFGFCMYVDTLLHPIEFIQEIRNIMILTKELNKLAEEYKQSTVEEDKYNIDTNQEPSV